MPQSTSGKKKSTVWDHSGLQTQEANYALRKKTQKQCNTYCHTSHNDQVGWLLGLSVVFFTLMYTAHYWNEEDKSLHQLKMAMHQLAG